MSYQGKKNSPKILEKIMKLGKDIKLWSLVGLGQANDFCK